MIDFIPPQHIEHLFDVHFEGDELDRFRSMVRSVEVAERHEALNALEERIPGTIERLSMAWQHRSSSSVYLWHVAAFRHQELYPHLADPFECAREHLKFGQTFVDESETQADSPDRPIEVKGEGGTVEAKIRLKTTRTSYVDGNPQQYLSTRDVIVCTSSRIRGLVESYASKRPGRDAVSAFLKSVLGLSMETPVEQPEQIVVRERQLKALAGEKLWGWIGVDGDDPSAEVGELSYTAHRAGERYVELDMQVPKVQAQDVSENRSRTFHAEFVHEDGFVEYVVFVVYLDRQSHLTFRGRTSLPAMKHIVHVFYENFRP